MIPVGITTPRSQCRISILLTREIEQRLKFELENEKAQEQLNAFEASEVEETKAPCSLSMKLNVISGKTFRMVPQGSKIQSIISVAEHQVIRNYTNIWSSP